MKKLITILLAAALLLAICAPALADENDMEIRVTGSATVSLAADTATMQIGVNTSSKDVVEAQNKNNAVMDAVIAAVVAAGVDKKDVFTSAYSVYMDYVDPADTNAVPGYQVNNTLNVVVRDLTIVSAVIDSAVSAGANNFYGLYFSSTEENAAYDLALKRAYEDAAHKAQVLAEASGMPLGTLKDIIADNNGYGAYGASNTYSMAADAARETVIMTGDVSVSASVTLVYSQD